MPSPALRLFVEQHQLPATYLTEAFETFQPLIEDTLKRLSSKRPFVLGINGCQGSGKSTTATFLEHVFRDRHALEVVNLSLDDFYLSKTARIAKAALIHPLFETRGVPGTHDIELALNTLNSLLAGNRTRLPRFDKATDDLFPEDSWPESPSNTDLIILEGWCVGAHPEETHALLTPINELEREQDSAAIWRTYVNDQLGESYQHLFNLIDCLVMFKAPSFDAVYLWRLEQEAKLAKKLLLTNISSAGRSGIMNESQIQHFIHFFQRLTEHMLIEMPERADYCYELNTERQVVNERHRDAHY